MLKEKVVTTVFQNIIQYSLFKLTIGAKWVFVS